MICMGINLKLYFSDVAYNDDNRGCEKAIEELFDNIFCNQKEYIKAEARVQNIEEVDEE